MNWLLNLFRKPKYKTYYLNSVKGRIPIIPISDEEKEFCEAMLTNPSHRPTKRQTELANIMMVRAKQISKHGQKI